MARKSRKRLNEEIQQEAQSKRSQVGIYIRLSCENNGYEDKESIENQEQYLKNYIKQHKEELELIEIYSDNGATGTNFRRKEWDRLMEDIKARRIDCLLVKDFSRIGRNYIEVGNYMETIFPFLNVRVISVNDNFDSQKEDFQTCMLQTSLINIMNEYYARDISKKTSYAKKTIQKKGDYASGVVPYGYKKPSDKRTFEIDPECGNVVKKIFEWRVQGKGCGCIANYLNELCIPSPGKHRFLNGETGFKRSENTKWKSKHVAGILKNPVYLGHMVQGKTRKSYFENNGKTRVLPETNWIIVENTHDPLITEEQFAITHQMAEESLQRYHSQVSMNATIPHVDNPLRKKIYCGKCGRLMARRSRICNGRRMYQFYCASAGSLINSDCESKYVQEDALLEAIGQVTDQELRMIGPILKKCERVSSNESQKKQTRQKIMHVKQEKIQWYSSMIENKVTSEEFEHKMEYLNHQQGSYEKLLAEIKRDEEKEKSVMDSLIDYRERIMDIQGEALPLELLDFLISKIVVFSKERIEIQYAFQDILQGGN